MAPDMACKCKGPLHNCGRSRLSEPSRVVVGFDLGMLPGISGLIASYEAILWQFNESILRSLLGASAIAPPARPAPPPPAPLGGPGPFWAAVRAIEKGGAT